MLRVAACMLGTAGLRLGISPQWCWRYRALNEPGEKAGSKRCPCEGVSENGFVHAHACPARKGAQLLQAVKRRRSHDVGTLICGPLYDGVAGTSTAKDRTRTSRKVEESRNSSIAQARTASQQSHVQIGRERPRSGATFTRMPSTSSGPCSLRLCTPAVRGKALRSTSKASVLATA
jgi:hypothetical protein